MAVGPASCNVPLLRALRFLLDRVVGKCAGHVAVDILWGPCFVSLQ